MYVGKKLNFLYSVIQYRAEFPVGFPQLNFWESFLKVYRKFCTTFVPV